MVREQFTAFALAAMLCLQPAAPLAAATGSDSSSTTEAAAEATTEFTWDEDTEGDAIAVWENTDWSQFQRKLLIDADIGTGAHADVDDAVRALEPTVENALTSSAYTPEYTPEYEMGDYVELVLAMIQILAEDSGALGSDGDSDLSGWLKDMGYLIDPTYNGKAGTGIFGTNAFVASMQGSVQILFDSFMRSCHAYKEKLSEKKDAEDGDDILEPSVFATGGDECMSLKAVIEGTAMQFSADSYKKNYVWSASIVETDSAYKAYYSEEKAQKYYDDKEDKIEAYYSALPDSYKDYRPSADFAERVANIYTTSSGTYSSAISNASVAAFIAALEECFGLKYVWGGNDGSNCNNLRSDGYDCSGFVSHGLMRIGVIKSYLQSTKMHDYAHNSSNGWTVITDDASLQTGDILWHGPTSGGAGHVAVYIKDGYVLESQSKRGGIGYHYRSTHLGGVFKEAFRWTTATSAQ